MGWCCLPQVCVNSDDQGQGTRDKRTTDSISLQDLCLLLCEVYSSCPRRRPPRRPRALSVAHGLARDLVPTVAAADRQERKFHNSLWCSTGERRAPSVEAEEFFTDAL